MHRLGSDPGLRRDFMLTGLTDSLALLRFGGGGGGGGAFMFLILLVVAGLVIYALTREPGSSSPKL
jgi:uncharacterized membrane protein